MANNFFTRIQHKIDTESNWNKAVNFVPLKGELIIYTDIEDVPGPMIKIGDGDTKLSELNFLWDEALTGLVEQLVLDYKSYTDTSIESISSVIADEDKHLQDQIDDLKEWNDNYNPPEYDLKYVTNGKEYNYIQITKDNVGANIPQTEEGNIEAIATKDGLHRINAYGDLNGNEISSTYAKLAYVDNEIQEVKDAIPEYELVANKYTPNAEHGYIKLVNSGGHLGVPLAAEPNDGAAPYLINQIHDGNFLYDLFAKKAEQDASGNNIVNTYATKTALNNLSSLVGNTSVTNQINNAIEDLGAITIDIDGSLEGSASGVDAKSLQGYTVDNFITYSIGDDDNETVAETFDATTLGGKLPSHYATAASVNNMMPKSGGGFYGHLTQEVGQAFDFKTGGGSKLRIIGYSDSNTVSLQAIDSNNAWITDIMHINLETGAVNGHVMGKNGGVFTGSVQAYPNDIASNWTVKNSTIVKSDWRTINTPNQVIVFARK